MSKKYSDHKKPQTDITQYLPEVFKSDVNKSVFDAAFNRQFTKDDTKRISGFIGEGNPAALVDRKIKESTPHRQLYQLAPTMHSVVGTTETALSFTAFNQQLELMGVDLNRYPSWGSTTQFNWVPPVNLDMLINYTDYFWAPDDPRDPAQYFTVENRFNKAQSKVNAYRNVLLQRGSEFSIAKIDFADNAFIIDNKMDDLFVHGFVFYTKNSTNKNIQNKFWTVDSSTFDYETNKTTVAVIKPIAPSGVSAPTNPAIGSWWFDTGFNTVRTWSSTGWIPTVLAISAIISLNELTSVYQAESNCICKQDMGWDMGLWDDNQVGSVDWNTDLMDQISHSTQSEWVSANDSTSHHPLAAPQPLDLWYDTTNDELKQRQLDNLGWVVVTHNFSAIVAMVTGNILWDVTLGCEAQKPTQWSTQNKWVHKSEVQSFTGIRRAEVPIFEYNSRIELNEWVKDTYAWKYRTDIDGELIDSTTCPSRLELEPVKGFVTVNKNGYWYVYMFDKNESVARDVDYTSVFVPGFQFRITDDEILSDVYTVATADFRETTANDPMAVRGDYMVTVVKLVETTYLSPTTGNNGNGTRIEPQQTSRGDVWRGYHAHWVLDTTKTTVTPAANQSLNLYHRKDGDSQISAVATDHGTMYVGRTQQEITLSDNGVLVIELVDALQFSPTITNVFAVAGSDDIRVYVNNIRQYGNYTENVAYGAPSYTVIGHAGYTNIQIPYVTGVTFTTPLKSLDVVRIEVGPAAQSDMGCTAIPVRTIEDEDEFMAAVSAGTQPVYKSLHQYRHVEQVKTEANQYPMFNVYDVVTGDVVSASNIFGFAENATAPVHSAVARRIIVSSDGREYEFEQSLLDVSDGLLYGYRNQSAMALANNYTPTAWWYNPHTRVIKGWDGSAWTSSAIMNIAGGVVFRTPIISDSEPSYANSQDSALWYNATTNTLYRRNVTSNQWVAQDAVVVGADPTLRTIWRRGTNNEQFVPQYVDKNGTPVLAGDSTGDWQVPDQWMYNPTHLNKSNVKLSEMITHTSTILRAQRALPGFLGGGLFTLTQDEYNYGVGGTIKEHNDGFDTLISAVNVNNVTPVGVMEFAQNEYASSLLFVRDLFTKSIIGLATSTSPQSLSSFGDYVVDGVIDRYQANEFMTQVYNDSSAFDVETGRGVENWIASAPMFKLGNKFTPHVVHNDTTTEIFHHDGHRSQVVFSAAEEDRFARLIVGQTDHRSEFGKLGAISTSVPPATTQAFVNFFDPSFRNALMHPGVFWYHINGTTRSLYRFNCYSVSPNAPVGNLPNGTKYYNTIANAVFIKTANGWTQSDADYSIAKLWDIVDFKQLLARAYLRIEKSLCDVTPDFTSTIFDYSLLRSNAADRQTYDKLHRSRFDSYVVTHNIRTPFVNNTYSATNPFTWNYVACLVTDAPRTGTVTPAACWQAVYTNWYNTPYPHLEPWCLQGFVSKPDWWDDEYLDTTGARKWKYNHATKTGMWENIRIGKVPAGRSYSNGLVSSGDAGTDGVAIRTYSYFSVNISDVTITGGYKPDDVLPPYYDNSAISISMPTVRSLFNSFSSQISAPNADYAFTDMGPVEWQWSTSIQCVYDLPIIAFLMQPAKFLHAAFGPQYIEVDGLQVETTFHKVYSHDDVLFHGDLYNTNQNYRVRGLNQWYVNFNRYSGYDTNTHFRQEWAGWVPRLTYQFGGIIDTESFDISNKYFDISAQDFDIVLVNNGVLNDVWVDAFEVSILSMPPSIIQYNNQGRWKFELDCLASIPRSIEYYGVKSYAATSYASTDTIHVLQYNIVGASAQARRFYVDGDHTSVLKPGRLIKASEAQANNGTYTIVSSLFEPTTDRTRIVVAEPVAASTVVGVIDVQGVGIDWDTGDQVVLSSTKILPAPFVINTPYYVVKVGVNAYKLAETFNDALNGITIDIATGGDGNIIISEISTSFNTFGGSGHSKDTWFHYALDMNDVRVFTPPMAINGMQQLINIIDGYVAVQKQRSVLYGVAEAGEFDPETGRTIDWQNEIERLIEWAFRLRATQVVISDRFNISADPTTNTLTFLDAIPSWASGTQVVLTTTGTLPAPLLGNTPYYVQLTDVDGTIRLSVTASVYDGSNIIDITSAGSGSISVGLYNRQNVYPSFELNPCRDSIWVETPVGVLADIIEGPYSDIRVQQTIFDQYSRPLKSDKLTVYREDGRSRIAIRPQIANDIELMRTNDPYGYIHFGGAHLFVEGYEHFMLLNDRTASNDLLYDSFYGIHAKKFNLDYYEKEDYTLRPTIGGYFLSDGKFKKNIEGAITDMREFYDVMSVAQDTDMAKRAQALVGYNGRTNYLDLLNINSKSQFMFYRGMLQTKGSVNSVTAYINSRRFVDAKMDEFWAWKLAEFGESRSKIYPEIKLFATDGVQDDVRLLFLSPTDGANDDAFADDVSKGFQPVSFADHTRWVNFPEQRDTILTPLFLDAEITSLSVVYSGVIPPSAEAISTNNIMYWYDGVLLRQLVDGAWTVVMNKATRIGTTVFWKHDTICDTTRVIRRAVPTTTQQVAISSTTPASRQFVIPGDFTDYFKPDTKFQVIDSTSNDGVYTVVGSSATPTTTVITVSELPPAAGATGKIVLLYREFGNYESITMGQGTGVNEFTIVNSEVIRFDETGFEDIVLIFTLNPAKNRISPAKLIDTRSHDEIHDAPLWHPALGHHYHVAQHNIDSMHVGDPAKYTFTMNPSDVSTQPWNATEEGHIWLDTGRLSYIPYYDSVVYPDVNDRLYQWGKLADWSSINVYKWVNSTTHPSQWDDLVIRDAGDSSVLQNDKATGTPRKTLFRRTRKMYNITSVDPNANKIVTTGTTFANGDLVLFSAIGEATAALDVGVKYEIANIVTVGSSQTFNIIDFDNGDVIDVALDVEQMRICPAFKATDWKKQSIIRDRIVCAMVFDLSTPITSPTLALKDRLWTVGDVADVYINGQYAASGVVNDDMRLIALNATITLSDIVDVIRPDHAITDDEAAFNPDAADDGTTLVQWVEDYEYAMTTVSTGSTSTGIKQVTHYHFWVKDVSTRPSTVGGMSPHDIALQLHTPPVPHFVVQRPMDDDTLLVSNYGYGVSKYGSVYNLTAVGDHYYLNPVIYRQAVLRNAASYITDDDRFVVRFARDLTLRDKLTPNENYASPKNKHEEWFLFRKNQPSTIPHQLWIKLTEALMGQSTATAIELSSVNGGSGYTDGVYDNVALIGGTGSGLAATIVVVRGRVVTCDVTQNGNGYTVDDVLTCTLPVGAGIGFSVTIRSIPSTRVPSLERELYDAMYNTDTRFGLGVDQAFVDKTLGIATIIDYLQNPTNDFYPADIDDFFLRNSFDSPQAVQTAMNEIYTTFPAAHTNAMWFETLHDAFSTRMRYKELMKTSWIALHGIRVLEVGGLFDD